jgi:hypothetical protein
MEIKTLSGGYASFHERLDGVAAFAVVKSVDLCCQTRSAGLLR